MGLKYFDQLTLYKPGGADYAHHITNGFLDLSTALHKPYAYADMKE